MQTPNASAAEPGAQSETSAGDRPVQQALNDALSTLSGWWRRDVTSTVDQIAVIEKRRAECTLSARYILLTCMSAGIAVLGLLQGSAAVVIGAMLLSPLMDPIMGLGFAFAIGDFKWLRQSAKSLAVGVLFAILFCALIVYLSPLQTITTEIAARTRPSLLDLGVAIFSSIAGAYAMIRGREGTIVGVAIATALMPPLAVVGFGLATMNATVFWGSLFLFITNLTAIALTATAMARAYGFSTSLSEKQTRMKMLVIAGAFVLLAVPLFLSLRQIVWETKATRQISNTVEEVFDGRDVSSQIDTNYDGESIQITATVFTPEFVNDAEAEAEVLLEERLEREVEVSLRQVITGSGARAQEEAQLAQAREQEAESRETAQTIADRLALLAGVPADDVTIDRDRRRAIVNARPLDSAGLAVYAELESRIDATEPEWDIRFVPPLRPLPDIAFERVEAGGDGNGPAQFQPTAAGQRALTLIAWAQQRTGIPIRLSGPAAAVTSADALLSQRGTQVLTSSDGSGFGTVSVEWVMGE